MLKNIRITTIMAGAALLWAGPAAADVKTGVEAWSRGDYAGAVREWEAAAAKGDADAQFNLGQAYRMGRGVAPDAKKAELYYARAAEQGHLQAADNYGLMLFQGGRREMAMPYVRAAAGRGDPRAQYLLGIAHFNGDLAEKDWIRAYALLSLANAAGLPQAPAAVAQMDQHIPLEQRQAAASLATQMQQDADASRARQLAAAELAPAGGKAPVITASRQASPAPIQSVSPPPLAVGASAARDAALATGTESPATAGADYARPAAAKPAPTAKPPVIAKPPAITKPTVAAPAAAGPWRLQLGAFGVAGNAEKLWSRIGGKGPLAGKTRLLEPAGRLTKLLAGGFASQADAAAACEVLKRDGQGCIVTR